MNIRSENYYLKKRSGSLNLRISDELSTFLGMPSGVKINYYDALQAIVAHYIMKNKLYKSHGEIYVIDSKIASLLDLKKNTDMTKEEFSKKNNLFRHFAESYEEYYREEREKNEIKEFEERFKIEQEKEEKEKRYQEFKKNKMLGQNKSYEKSNIDKISNWKPFVLK
jgi:hypothetical protein